MITLEQRVRSALRDARRQTWEQALSIVARHLEQPAAVGWDSAVNSISVALRRAMEKDLG